MDDHDEEKRTEQNLIVRSGKYEAEVTNNRRLRCVRLKLTILTDTKHRAASLRQQGYLFHNESNRYEAIRQANHVDFFLGKVHY